MQNTKEIALREDASKGADIVTDVLEKFWESIPDNEKGNFFEKAFEYLKGEGGIEVWNALKEGMKTKDRALTEEDKEALARNLNIDRSILEGADTVFTAIELLLEATPKTIGKLWDIFQLGPIDEAVAVIPGVGPILAAITGIFSFIPEGTLIGMITSAGIKLKLNVLKWLKNILIHKVIPEPEEVENFKKELSESVKNRELTESLNSFAAEFKEYEALWD